jgi:hypothetical protein
MFRYGGAWEVAERLAEPTVHGRLAAWLVGVCVALCFAVLGVWALAYAAIATGTVLISLGVLLHFRCFWSSYPALQPYSEIGTNVAALVAILGIGYGFYYFVANK